MGRKTTAVIINEVEYIIEDKLLDYIKKLERENEQYNSRIQKNLGSVVFKSRGIGMDSGNCFVPGCEVSGMLSNIAAFVDTKEDGEKVVQMFNTSGVYLDYRTHEPNWIQVKVCACSKHLPALETLQELTCRDNKISSDIIWIAGETGEANDG